MKSRKTAVGDTLKLRSRPEKTLSLQNVFGNL